MAQLANNRAAITLFMPFPRSRPLWIVPHWYRPYHPYLSARHDAGN